MSRGRIVEVSKQDWKLFRIKLPDWQEAYMERLNKEYIELLLEEGNASDKFWKLSERIRHDKQSRGVVLRLSKQSMLWDIVAMINDDVISFDELEGFSEDLKETVQRLCNREF